MISYLYIHTYIHTHIDISIYGFISRLYQLPLSPEISHETLEVKEKVQKKKKFSPFLKFKVQISQGCKMVELLNPGTGQFGKKKQ
jgi:hypothetical protein